MENVSLQRVGLEAKSFLCLRGERPSVSQEAPRAPSLRAHWAGPRWSYEKLVSALRRVCQLLEWAHEAGFVHRALTPEAIFISDDEVAIGGWEHCHPLSESAPPLTPYSAPEAARKASSEIDAKSDLFSLGAVWYEWITGRAPYRGETPLALLRAIIGPRPPEPASLRPDCPSPLSLLCLQLLHTEKGARPHSAKALSTLLQEMFSPAYADTLQRVDPAAPSLGDVTVLPKEQAINAQPLPEGAGASSPDTGRTVSDLQSNDPLGSFPLPGLTLQAGEPYVRLEELGRGGLGLVTKAKDKRLGRVVAIKELLRTKGAARERFLREAFITAKLQHPGVVPIYEAGVWPSGEPFYAMKLIAGKSLEKLIKETQSLQERLALLPNVLAAAEAIAYAHHHKTIHRDLKPHNIVVGEFGETVVIDWGLAKELGSEEKAPDLLPSAPYRVEAEPGGLTQTGEVMGTPAYMPPEQAKGEPVDERADVYSLGAILYHLLTQKPPYLGKKSLQVIRELLERPPISLTEHEPNAPKALVAIVEKAMAREASERYPSAKELADDLKKYLSGQLVGAHQYSLWEQCKLWISQNQKTFWVGAAASALLLVGGVVSVLQIIDAKNEALKERKVALEQKKLAEDATKRERAYRLQETLTSAEVLLDKDPRGTLRSLQKIVKEFPEYPEKGRLRTLAADALSRGVPRTLPESAGRESDQSFDSVAKWSSFSSDGKYIAAGSLQGEVKLWSSEGAFLRVLLGHTGKVLRGAFSPKEALLASAGEDGTVRLWEIPSGKARFTLQKHTAPIRAIAFSPDGTKLVSGGDDQTLYLWDTTTGEGKLINTHRWKILDVAFSPDGAAFAAACGDGAVQLFSLDGAFEEVALHPFGARFVRFSPDGELLASSGFNGEIQFWSMSKKQELRTISIENSPSEALVFSPDSKKLLRSGADQALELWDVQTCTTQECQPTLFPEQQKVVYAAEFSPDGARLVTVGTDTIVHLLDATTLKEIRSLRGHKREVLSVGFSPDGKQLVSSSSDQSVLRWSLQELSLASYRVGGDPMWMGASPDGEWVAVALAGGNIELWNLKTGASQTLQGHSADALSVGFSPDGEHFASTDALGGVLLWSLRSMSLVRRYEGHTGTVFDVRFSPDGKSFATVSDDKTIRVWETTTEKGRAISVSYTSYTIDFSPDGATLVLFDVEAGCVRFVGIASGKETKGIKLEEITQDGLLKISPDAKHFAVADSGTGIHLCNIQEAPPCGKTVLSAGRTVSLDFSKEDQKLASAGADGSVRIWELASQSSRALATRGNVVVGAQFLGNGETLAFVDNSRTLTIASDNLPPPEKIAGWLSQQRF